MSASFCKIFSFSEMALNVLVEYQRMHIMWKGAEDLSDPILFFSSRAHGWTTLEAMPR
jgi:hypothetical protein